MTFTRLFEVVLSTKKGVMLNKLKKYMQELKSLLLQHGIILNEMYEDIDWNKKKNISSVYRKGDYHTNLNTLEYSLKLYREYIKIELDLVFDSTCVFYHETDYSDLTSLANLIAEHYNNPSA